MKLFRSKIEETKTSCCSESCDLQIRVKPEFSKPKGNSIKVLGAGCKKCMQLEAVVKEALLELDMNTEIEHVKDFSQIAAYGVITTPALVVEGKVVSYGKVLKKADVILLLQKYR